jgi:hypothetical protein
MTEKTIKTVRFNKQDIKDIETFLKKNPLIDFSTLVRISVQNFIKNPNFKLNSIGNLKKGNRYGTELN